MRRNSQIKGSREVLFLCGLCGEHLDNVPMVGLRDDAWTAASIFACPHCGPRDWELMEICREVVLGYNLN